MPTRSGRCSWLCLLLVVVAIWMLQGRGRAESQVIETAVRVPPAKQPALYLRFRNNKLWMAASQAKLEKATPIRAARVDLDQDRDTGIKFQSYDFPEINLPLSLPGTQSVKATFYTYRRIGKGNDAPPNVSGDETHVSGAFLLSKRGGSGAVWTYTLTSSAACDTAKLPAQRLELTLPKLDPDRLTLGIEIKVEEKNARIGLKVRSGEIDIENVMRGEVKAPATIEILDLKGKTVVSEKGNLKKFGFT